MAQINPSDFRLYARFECLEDAILQSEQGDHKYQATLLDIGLGGVQIESNEPLPTDTKLLLVLEAKEGGLLLKVHGKAKYCNAPQGSSAYMTGFKFVPESHQERVAIAEFVHDVFQRQWEILGS
jgi:hypothetical protein